MNTIFIEKLAWLMFLFGLALFFFHFGFPYLETLIAIAALILGILHLL